MRYSVRDDEWIRDQESYLTYHTHSEYKSSYRNKGKEQPDQSYECQDDSRFVRILLTANNMIENMWKHSASNSESIMTYRKIESIADTLNQVQESA